MGEPERTSSFPPPPPPPLEERHLDVTYGDEANTYSNNQMADDESVEAQHVVYTFAEDSDKSARKSVGRKRWMCLMLTVVSLLAIIIALGSVYGTQMRKRKNAAAEANKADATDAINVDAPDTAVAGTDADGTDTKSENESVTDGETEDNPAVPTDPADQGDVYVTPEKPEGEGETPIVSGGDEGEQALPGDAVAGETEKDNFFENGETPTGAPVEADADEPSTTNGDTSAETDETTGAGDIPVGTANPSDRIGTSNPLDGSGTQAPTTNASDTATDTGTADPSGLGSDEASTVAPTTNASDTATDAGTTDPSGLGSDTGSQATENPSASDSSPTSGTSGAVDGTDPSLSTKTDITSGPGSSLPGASF
mmetsp:Transcript_4039/g.9380  ORF Transcript_4039/g.9380 Transcript_4039/m.9380 type:complete len:368 (-) Transcript_4039:265-1368(-)